MNLQGRDLKLELSGDDDDVRLLQTLLALIGLRVPYAEQQHDMFGPGTRDAVMRFQKGQCLEPTGVVDAENAKEINQAVDANIYRVEGTVENLDRAGVAGCASRSWTRMWGRMSRLPRLSSTSAATSLREQCNETAIWRTASRTSDPR